MRQIEYKNVLKPSVEFLERCGILMLDTQAMAEFLGLSSKGHQSPRLHGSHSASMSVGDRKMLSLERHRIARMGRSWLSSPN